MMNAQISETIKKNPFEIYIDGENLTNYTQHESIIAVDQPSANISTPH
jgi:hypothetical protein